MQVHSNATTNKKQRERLQASTKTCRALAEEMAISVDLVVENVQQFFAMVGGTKASEISWLLRVAELATAPLFHALSIDRRKDRIKSRMRDSQFDAFQ